VPRRVRREDLDDVAGLPVEEMRDLLGAVLERDDEPLPVDVERHKPDMIRVSLCMDCRGFPSVVGSGER
jgi:hypothetical protein